jgi:hypothetical protein
MDKRNLSGTEVHASTRQKYRRQIIRNNSEVQSVRIIDSTDTGLQLKAFIAYPPLTKHKKRVYSQPLPLSISETYFDKIFLF